MCEERRKGRACRKYAGCWEKEDDPRIALALALALAVQEGARGRDTTTKKLPWYQSFGGPWFGTRTTGTIGLALSYYA